MSRSNGRPSFEDFFTDPLLSLAAVMMAAGIVLCYFVWLCKPLCVICLLLFLAGAGLWKLKLPRDLYYILSVCVILCIFPVLTVTGILLFLSIDAAFQGVIAVKRGSAASDGKELMKIIFGRVMLLTVCVGLTVVVMLWLGGLRRIDCELKPGESLIVCFPYEERKLSIGYISKDKSISEDTTTCTVVKNTATGVEKRIRGNGNYGRSEYGAVIMNANTEYLISLKTDNANAVAYTIILAWPCRLSDIFFKGFRVLSSASEFVKLVKAGEIREEPRTRPKSLSPTGHEL